MKLHKLIGASGKQLGLTAENRPVIVVPECLVIRMRGTCRLDSPTDPNGVSGKKGIRTYGRTLPVLFALMLTALLGDHYHPASSRKLRL